VRSQTVGLSSIESVIGLSFRCCLSEISLAKPGPSPCAFCTQGGVLTVLHTWEDWSGSCRELTTPLKVINSSYGVLGLHALLSSLFPDSVFYQPLLTSWLYSR
jgi:hypothetical protein